MQNLKTLRQNKGVTQQEIADQLGITRAAYTNIENGKRETDFTTLNKLANYFDVSIDYLFGKTDDPTPPGKKKPPSEEWGLEVLENALRKAGQLEPDQHLTMEQFRSFIKSYQYWHNISKQSE